MNVEYRKQFIAGMNGIKNKELADEIEFIIESIKKSNSLHEIPGIKKLSD